MKLPAYPQFFIFAIVLLLTTTSHTTQAEQTTQLLSFEQTIDSQQINATNSRLTITDQQAKFGQHSLKWQFSAGSELTLNQHIGFKTFNPNAKKQARHTFMTWLYNETPIKDKLTFQFAENQQVAVSFDVNLDFQGWRAVAVPFETDMQGQPHEAMNQLIVKAPAALSPSTTATIYFDLMALSIPVDPRWPTPDFQVPHVNKAIMARANAHWGALLTYDEWQQQYEQLPHTPTTSAEQSAIAQITARIDQDILNSFNSSLNKSGKVKERAKHKTRKALRSQQQNLVSGKYAENTLNRGEERYFTDNGQLKPIQMGRQLEVYKKAPINKQQWQSLNKETVKFRQVARHLLQLARAYRLTKPAHMKAKVKKQFTSLVAHMYQQGYVRGSAVGIMHHQGYSMREWSKALFLGREMLNPELLKDSQQAIAWLTGLGRIFRPEQENNGFNVDVMNTFLPGMLMSIVMQTEQDLQVAYLRALSQWMSYSMLAIKGLSGGIQPDGSFYHHAQHYVAYGNGGLNGLTPVVYYLSHTPFALSDDAYLRLRHGVMMTRLFSNGLKAPISLAGRHPEKYEEITLAPFKYLTLMGDKKVASAYLRLANIDTNKLKNKAISITPEATPNGAWVMNYSSLAIQRRNDWLATARGFSRYLVGNESYADANHFGRYMNYGHVEILPSATQDGGYQEAGWNWNRWPGTTTVHLPLDLLAANIYQVDQYSGVEEMLLSTQSYAGANHLDQQNAMFAMKLEGHAKYNDDLTANKSVFFFDNRMVALGSNISNSNRHYPTETTLFQQSISEDQPSFIGTQAITGNNTNKPTQLNTDSFYLDTLNNAYFIPKDQTVLFARQHQQSLENERKQPTEGDFASLVLSHGKAPQNASYQYAVLIGSTPTEAQNFHQQLDSKTPPYQVLQQDKHAHIVHDKATDITGYALFSSNQQLADSLIAANDTPIMVMAQVKTSAASPAKQGKQASVLKLAVTDPDLNLYQGVDANQVGVDGKQKEVSIYSTKWRHNQPQAKTNQLTLNGLWQGQGEHYQVLSHDNNQTVLAVTSIAATPVQIQLTQI
ncbi:chondroitinase family polysaccharide lyase [Thalassotalea montiporae]